MAGKYNIRFLIDLPCTSVGCQVHWETPTCISDMKCSYKYGTLKHDVVDDSPFWWVAPSSVRQSECALKSDTHPPGAASLIFQ